ncbi:MAG: MBL fold metallo-hydrolase [Candidatus Eremiobacteraeota bacterium]|nr:MBL fold metallo-hydrolase [Candidatus Eremiobacteraeota bacterium]
MKIRYIGHSCFLFTSDAGIKLLIDPFDEKTMAGSPNLTVDAVLMSHGHADHFNFSMVSGSTEVIFGAGRHDAGGVIVQGHLADHGSCNGEWLGNVICYGFQMDGVNILHLSDIGEVPCDSEIKEIGHVDVLFIPVGGHFTIGPEKAAEIIEKINPSIVIPMHFSQPGLDRADFPIKSVDEFVQDKNNVKHFRTGEAEINLENLPDKQEVWVMTRF